jgi:hypothetical protein
MRALTDRRLTDTAQNPFAGAHSAGDKQSSLDGGPVPSGRRPGQRGGSTLLYLRRAGSRRDRTLPSGCGHAPNLIRIDDANRGLSVTRGTISRLTVTAAYTSLGATSDTLGRIRDSTLAVGLGR